MKVILKQDVKGSGKQGDVIEVSDGYAKNFLLKKGLAEPATASGLNEISQRKTADAYHKAENEKQLRELAKKVNGKTVSVTQLREIGEKLAAIHGQHDHDALLDPARHTAFLDAYADDGVLLSAYREDYGRLKELAERIRSLKTENRDRGKRLELLKYQVAEIDDAAVKEGEEEP